MIFWSCSGGTAAGWQIGGDDQWSNILAGADLIRRKEREDAFALTNKLIMTSDGKKMGKTEKGALWLDPKRTNALRSSTSTGATCRTPMWRCF
jgi:tyrosyl-tRNA synthetase